jgi:hypothetical protein
MSRAAFREKLALLRRERDTEFMGTCLEFRQRAAAKLATLHLADPHVLYLAKHIPKKDALQLREYANRSMLWTEDEYHFHAFPETMVMDDDPDAKEILTGLWTVLATF